jgi:hypothetical protein
MGPVWLRARGRLTIHPPTIGLQIQAKPPPWSDGLSMYNSMIYMKIQAKKNFNGSGYAVFQASDKESCC